MNKNFLDFLKHEAKTPDSLTNKEIEDETKRILSESFVKLKGRRLFTKEKLKINNFNKAINIIKDPIPDITTSPRYSVCGGLQKIEDSREKTVDVDMRRKKLLKTIEKILIRLFIISQLQIMRFLVLKNHPQKIFL